jgi:CelD/BcsL family acetyltransferase involved in cellulose biosynthesis
MTWTLRTLNYPFYLVGRKAFTIGVRMHVLETAFTQLSNEPDGLELPLAAGDGAEGAVAPSHPVTADLPRFGRRGSLVRLVPTHYDRFLVDLGGTFEAHMASKMTGESRYKLRRKVKKLAEMNGGRDAVRVYRTPEEMLEFHRLAGALAEKTYQARLFRNALPQDDAFRDQLVDLARQDRTIGSLLFLGDRPIAYWWFTINGGTVVSEYTGYDADQRNLSPGIALLYRMLEILFADKRYQVLDFGEGNADYKETFASRSVRCADVYYFRPLPRPLAIVSLDSMLAAGRRLAKPVEAELERRGLKARLRRLVRA